MATSTPAPRAGETATAIIVSFVFAVIVASLLVGSPIRAVRLAFTDVGLANPNAAHDPGRAAPANPAPAAPAPAPAKG